MQPPKDFETFIKQNFTSESQHKIDYLEKDHHQRKVIAKRHGLIPEDQVAILEDRHSVIRHLCLVMDLDKVENAKQENLA